MNHYSQSQSFGAQRTISNPSLICSSDGFVELDPLKDICFIDDETAKTLELVQNNVDVSNRRHTLLGFLNSYSATTTGARLLKESILKPLCNYEVIEHRLDCVDYLVNRIDTLASISNCIKKYGQGVDLDAVVPCIINLSKNRFGTLSTAEKKLDALETLETLMTQVVPLLGALELADEPTLNVYKTALLDPAFEEILLEISSKVETDARTTRNRKKKLLRIKPGIDALFDIARQSYTAAMQDLEEYTKDLSREDGIPWKLSHSEARGYYLTVATNQVKKDINLSDTYINVNRTRIMISCTTKGLMQLNVRANISYLNSMKLANDMLSEIFRNIVERIGPINRLVCVIGMLDMITSFAKLVNSNQGVLVRPKFSSTDTILSKARHPVLETVLRVNNLEIVPNDTILSTGSKNFMLVTGPNMGGKSIFLKQLGIIQIMAQIGCFVPAESALIKIMHRIVARSGSSDDNQSNCSSFMWEMKGMASALRKSETMTEQSVLYLIDEVGRGTSIEDGASYSFAIAEELALRRYCFTVFATHFDQVFSLTTLYNNVSAYHFKYEEDVDVTGDNGKRLKITHELIPGLAEKDHYGLKMAEACGIPEEILRAAYSSEL
jgi:DNA mismatch repair protein MSH4